MFSSDSDSPRRLTVVVASGVLALAGIAYTRIRRRGRPERNPAMNMNGGYGPPVRVDRIPAVMYAMTQRQFEFTLDYVSPQVEMMVGYSPEEWKADIHNWRNHLHEEDRERVVAERERCYRTGEPFQVEYRLVGRGGRVVWVQDDAMPVTAQGDDEVRWEGVITDVTPLKEAESRLTRQIERIDALRAIDLAITSSLDARVALDVVLDQVTTQLAVDGAAILLMSPHTRELEHAADRGFRSREIVRTRIPLGSGMSGRAAFNRETIFVSNVTEVPERLRSGLLHDEQVISYAATPLISKGQVIGLLEIFHRNVLNPDDDWFGYLEALAAQAAIAIESARMFDQLQRSNDELELAYDRTLEGWSRALELRDDETKGHSQRVTDLTMQLARSAGVNDQDLVNIRRGALLHDIGKFGVPDRILLKPGPLDQEERKEIEKHPELARELLSHINFLEPAIDIPYSHHERWNGSGYPQGLKGWEIPLPARIFAVVDVWDALISDRPYRSAWDREAARQYLREQAGHQFDPKMVNLFLDRLPAGE